MVPLKFKGVITLIVLVNLTIAGTASDEPGYVLSIPRQSSDYIDNADMFGLPNLSVGKSLLTIVLAALSLATITLIYGKFA